MKRVLAATLLMGLVISSPAVAQGLTTEAVAAGFVEAVTLCAKAKIGGGGIAQLPASDTARVAAASAQTRTFARAPEGRPVWDVVSARGIVLISEPTDTDCDVTAYGPRVRPVFDEVARVLAQSEFNFSEVAVAPDPSSILRSFERGSPPHHVSVRLDGGEPGMPGRAFRFPMLLAFVRAN